MSSRSSNHLIRKEIIECVIKSQTYHSSNTQPRCFLCFSNFCFYSRLTPVSPSTCIPIQPPDYSNRRINWSTLDFNLLVIHTHRVEWRKLWWWIWERKIHSFLCVFFVARETANLVRTMSKNDLLPATTKPLFCFLLHSQRTRREGDARCKDAKRN